VCRDRGAHRGVRVVGEQWQHLHRERGISHNPRTHLARIVVGEAEQDRRRNVGVPAIAARTDGDWSDAARSMEATGMLGFDAAALRMASVPSRSISAMRRVAATGAQPRGGARTRHRWRRSTPARPETTCSTTHRRAPRWGSRRGRGAPRPECPLLRCHGSRAPRSSPTSRVRVGQPRRQEGLSVEA
jgi:hypothetical protein